MVSERMRRQLERLLDEAEVAVSEGAWQAVVEKARAALTIEPENVDAQTFLAMAVRNGGVAPTEAELPAESTVGPSSGEPTSFANGRYEVRRFLGEGGKKKVYLAHDSLLDRDVAFALIKTEGLDEQAQARIMREAQAMGRLGDHPHIVTVYDIGQEPTTGQPFLVLPLMPGGDIEGVLKQSEDHRLTLEEAVRLTDELCQALAFAHERGIVHRDVKPGNVWLAEGGAAKLGDFGLAVAVDRSRLTQAGMMVGTVSYMPPEQATGGEVTARSDLYSVGAMLYELVTGRPPFVGDDNVAIIGQHLNTPPVAPSWHRPGLPAGLETLIVRLLEKDPSRRPASAAEVREALAAIDLSSHDAVPESVGIVRPTVPIENPLYRRTFVGREAELRQLQAAFDGALSGQGALAMVVGEPGIGKTALSEQLRTYVALRGGRTLVGHCYEEGSLSLPYLAFVEALRSHVLAREPDALREELGTGAADIARIVSEVRDRAQVELRPPGDPDDDRWRLLQAVSGFLRNASTVQPLLVVLEDLHWADRGTLDVLLHVARNLEGARLMVVGSYRDVEVDRSHPLSATLAELSRVTTFSRVRLRGLTAEEVQRMLSALATQEVPWGLAEAVHRQTEGHPLFIQEVMRYLVEEGLLAREEGRWRRTGDQSLALAIPEGLRDVIGKRLSRLSAAANRLLAIAAVIGRDFRLETLGALASLEEEQLIASLDEAVKAGVLEERSQVGGVQYRFAHAFFRQTLYEELSAPRRLRLHQEVARALEAQYAGRRQDHAAELAEHFANSTDRADLAKAVEYGELAAQRAMSVFDYGEAVGLLERALDVQEVLNPDDREKRCDLLLMLGEALMPVGEPRRAADVAASAAFELAAEVGDSARCYRASQLALTALQQWGGAPVSRDVDFHRWAARADTYARPDSIERASADYWLARVANQRGLNAESSALRQHSLELARAHGDSEALFHAAFGFFSYLPASATRLAIELAREFADRSTEGVSARTESNALYGCAESLMMSGERDRTEEIWRRITVLAEQTHDAGTILRAITLEIERATIDGRLEDAVEAGQRLRVRAEEVGSPLIGLAVSEGALVLLGRPAEALAMRLGSRGPEDSAFGRVRTPHMIQASHFAAVGRLEEARQILARFWVTEAADVEARTLTLGNLAVLLDLAVTLRDLASTEGLAEAVQPFSDLSIAGIGAGTGPRTPARLLGGAAALLGKPEEARVYYIQALEAAGKIRFRPEIALTRLQLAELLIEHYPDEAAEAQEHLDFAIGEFREMKMQPSIEQALRHKGLLKA